MFLGICREFLSRFTSLFNFFTVDFPRFVCAHSSCSYCAFEGFYNGVLCFLLGSGVFVILLSFSGMDLLNCFHPLQLSVFQLSRHVGFLGSLILIDIRIVLWSVSFSLLCPGVPLRLLSAFVLFLLYLVLLICRPWLISTLFLWLTLVQFPVSAFVLAAIRLLLSNTSLSILPFLEPCWLQSFLLIVSFALKSPVIMTLWKFFLDYLVVEGCVYSLYFFHLCILGGP